MIGLSEGGPLRKCLENRLPILFLIILLETSSKLQKFDSGDKLTMTKR